MNLTQRWCSRRLPSSPRARAAAGARSQRSRMVLPTPVAGAVVPGGLDQQPADVAVAGLGDRPLGCVMLPEEYSAGHQPDEGADGVAGEPVPVADLDGQREPGQGADPAQAAQPAHERGELAVGGHLLDRGVEPVPAGLDRQHGLVVGVEGQPGRPRGQLRQRLVAQPGVVLAGPGRRRRSRRSRGAAAASTAGAGPASDHRGSPPGPGPDPGRLPGRRVGIATAVISSSRSSRARWTASLASVLTRSPAGRCSLRRRRDLAPDPGRGQRPVQPEPGRAGLVGHRHRARQTLHPGP